MIEHPDGKWMSNMWQGLSPRMCLCVNIRCQRTVHSAAKLHSMLTRLFYQRAAKTFHWHPSALWTPTESRQTVNAVSFFYSFCVTPYFPFSCILFTRLFIFDPDLFFLHLMWLSNWLGTVEKKKEKRSSLLYTRWVNSWGDELSVR